MEKTPNDHNSAENILLKKYNLVAGEKMSFQKIAIHTSSEIPVGAVQEGVLANDVQIGKRIDFQDTDAAISKIREIEEKDGQLLIHTQTSTYILQREDVSQAPENFTWDDIDEVETSKGSSYRYLPDGTTQRFKKVEGRDYEPQSALVYVPSFDYILEHATPEQLKQFGDNETVYEQKILTYVQNPLKDGRKVYIVDENGKQLETNDEIKRIKDEQGQIYLAFSREEGKSDFWIPVSHKPIRGFYTFDTRTYTDEKTGEYMRERHLGNKVVKVTLKNK